MYLLVPEAPDHTLEDVPDLCLEMILVVVRPAKKSRNELRQLWPYQVFWERMDRQFNKTKSRLDNFAVCRGEEYKECREYLIEHVCRDCVYYRERRPSTRLDSFGLIHGTFELEDQPRYRSDSCTDHVWCCTS